MSMADIWAIVKGQNEIDGVAVYPGSTSTFAFTKTVQLLSPGSGWDQRKPSVHFVH